MKHLLILLTFFCLIFTIPTYATTNEAYANTLSIENVKDETITKYTKTNVNIRKEPSLEAEIIKTVPFNTEIFTLNEIDNNWTSIIEYEDNNPIIYYIATQYLSDEKINIDPDMRYWLAHCINGEMEDESWEDHLYTGSVILNRVKSPHYPNTIIDVIKDRKWGIQYACYYDGNFQKNPKQLAWDAADYLLIHGSILPENVVFQAEFRQGHGTYIKTKAAYYCVW